MKPQISQVWDSILGQTITIFSSSCFTLPQAPAFGVRQRQGLPSHADICSNGLSLLFSSPPPTADVWLRTCTTKVAPSPTSAQFSACCPYGRAGVSHRGKQRKKEMPSSLSVALPSTREIPGDGSIPPRRGAAAQLPSAANHQGLIKWRPLLADTCTELEQLFFSSFPSVTDEQGRGNALQIHTRTQTTDSLLWEELSPNNNQVSVAGSLRVSQPCDSNKLPSHDTAQIPPGAAAGAGVGAALPARTWIRTYSPLPRHRPTFHCTSSEAEVLVWAHLIPPGSTNAKPSHCTKPREAGLGRW